MRRIGDILKIPGLPWLLAAGVALCVAYFSIWYGGLNQDEGWYLYAAQLVSNGKLPYRDFFFTQGPTLPFVYSSLTWIWGQGSPFSGLLGGRIVTFMFGLFATACAIGLVRRLVPEDRRGRASLIVFALLACNVYHVYFTTIPKTYALGSLFVLAGFLLLTYRSPFAAFAGGLSLAFATGTRISLLLILPVVGVALLVKFRTFRWRFLWFGLGGALGLFLTYGMFALDSASRAGLLAAQSYHAARGGFDPFFALGSVSRLARGYAALGAVLFGVLMTRRPAPNEPRLPVGQSTVLWMMGLSFAAVFLLQISAPFPYDDYQVPLMGLLTVLIASWYCRRGGAAWFAVLAACLVSFTSPLLQEWTTYAPDRFWSQKKEQTELAKLREMGRVVNALDPDGTELLTQDLYLAVETGRMVPSGLEMGPFSYFPEMPTEKARAVHVLNDELMEELLDSAPCRLAACSGYAFAISAPTCAKTPDERVTHLHEVLHRHYKRAYFEENFGQNATMLLLLERRDPLSLWRDGAPAKTALLEYLKSVTAEGSPDYIPPVERVAVFDFDGTLFCETDPTYFDWQLFEHRVLDDPSYKHRATTNQLAAARAARSMKGPLPDLTPERERLMLEVYEGMTLDEFAAYVRAFMDEPQPGFTGMKRGEAFYLPMLQVVKLLKSRGFRVYVCSGSDRLLLREIVGDALDLPPDRLIGSDSLVVARGQNGKDGLKYIFSKDDALVMGGRPIIKNLQMNKVPVIVREIGMQPVLAFGNSFTDASMVNYTLANNPHRALGFMLLCDDTVREYGREAKAQKLREACPANGWIPVSMRDDWTTIYGDGVEKKRATEAK